MSYRVVLILGMLLWMGPPARAQNPSGRPYQALFGGATTDPSIRNSLDFSITSLEAYDDNVLGDYGDLAAPTDLSRGFYSGLSGVLDYGFTGRRLQISATAGSELRYYGRLGGIQLANQYGAIGLTASLSKRTKALVNQSVTYAPSLFYSLIPGFPLSPGEAVGAGSDYAVGKQDTIITDTNASLTTGLTRRASLTFLGTYRNSNNSGAQSPLWNLSSYGAGGRFLYNLSRDATLHLGYVYREGAYPLASGASLPVVVHDIDAGVDYARALSFSRRTHVNFSVGSTIVNEPVVESAGARLQYRMIGQAGLSHDIGRTWRVRGAYERGIGFVEALPDPVFADKLRVTADGFFTRRIDFLATAGMSLGDVQSVGAPQNLRTYDASSRLRIAVSSPLAVFAEYLFYNYDLSGLGLLPAGIPGRLNRNSVRVGLTLWAPLLRR